MVKINGVNADIAGKTVAEYLAEAGYNEARVAVEINGEIVKKSQYKAVAFSDGDEAEVVAFVGGG